MDSGDHRPGDSTRPEPGGRGGLPSRTGGVGGRANRHRAGAAQTSEQRPSPSGDLDEAVGPLVRPYTVTGGRTRPVTAELDMISVVAAAHPDIDRVDLQPELKEILALCRQPLSVAEVSAHLALPLTVATVLISDLMAKGDVLVQAPLPMAELPDMNVLQAVIDGIRRL